MTKADIAFPPALGDLAGVSNADLIALAKQLKGEVSDLPDNYLGLTHFMSKADKIDWLGANHYGSGLDVSHVIPGAKAKYADFLAKAAAKKAGNAAPKGAGSTNCSATAMKEIESLAATVGESPELQLGATTTALADLDQFAASALPDLVGLSTLSQTELDTVLGGLQSWKSSFSALAKEATGAPEQALAGSVSTGLTSVKNIVGDVAKYLAEPGASDLTLSDTKVITNSLASLKSQLGVLADAAKAQDPTNLKAALDIVQGHVNAVAKSISTDNLKKLSLYKTTHEAEPSWDALVNGLADTNGLKLDGLLTAADQKALGEVYVQSAFAQLDALLTAGDVPALTETEVKAAQDVFTQIAAKDWVPDFASHGLSNLADALGNHAAEQAAQAWKGFLPEFTAKTNVELKQLAYQEFEAHGFKKSLGSFLTKDEKAELLAKFKAGQPVDDLAAKAQANYEAKEAAAKGKSAVNAGDVVSEQVPATIDPGTIATVEQQLATGDLDHTSPDFDLLKAIGETGEEHLVPTEPIVVETEPHAPPAVTHVFTPTGNRPKGGSHKMEIFTDENGDKWLFKVQGKVLSDIEDFASQVGKRLGFDVVDIRTESHVATSLYGVQDGSFQRLYTDVRGELHTFAEDFTKLTADQIRQLQEHQVYDWLISNHDAHDENMLIALDGRLLPIDKGQTFKFFGSDLLSTSYNPNFSPPVYNILWRQVEAGVIKLDFSAIDEILTRVEQIPDAEYREMVRRGVQAKYAAGGAKLANYLPPEMRDLEKFLDAAVQRKVTIRADFEKFYGQIAKRAGVQWTPVWAEDVRAAAKVVGEAEKLAVIGDVATPVTAEFAASVGATNSAGRALHMAGEEINQGQVLVWQETGTDGKPILRMELRLESQADGRLTKVFEDASGASGTAGAASGVASGGTAADTTYDAVMQAAKTVNHHAADGAYNQSKIDAMIKVNGDLFKVIDAADAADAKLAAGDITTEEWATLKAAGEQATHYKQVINDIQDGATFQHKVSHVVKFDADKAKQGWLAKAPSVANAPAPTLSQPPGIFAGKPKLVGEHVAITDSGPGYLERVRTGAQRDIQVGAMSGYVPPGEVSVSNGRQFEGVVQAADGSQVKVTWSSWNMTSNYTGKSRLTFEISGWDGTEAGVRSMLSALDSLGVDSHLATVEEEKLTYWSVVTGQMKNSVEYASPSQASGSYKGLKDTIHRIEKRVATGQLSTKEKIDIYRQEFATQFGQEAVDRAPEAISHIHDLHGNEVGLGHFERFDLPSDLRPFFEKSGRQYGVTRKANMSRELLGDAVGSTSNGEKIRLGLPGAAGTSGTTDLATGGGTGSFGSMGVTSWQSSGPVVIYNPSSLVRRASTYHADGDNFGRIWGRTTRNYLNPAEWGRYIGTGVTDATREIVVRDSYSFADDVEVIFAQSDTQRAALVQAFKDQGVSELRGLPIEDRVKVARNADLSRVSDQWFRAHPEAYTHTYSNPVDLTPGKGAAKAVQTASTPLIVSVAPKGSFEAEQDAYKNALSLFDSTTNSVKAKVNMLAAQVSGAGTKTSASVISDEFTSWWEKVGNHSGLSQVKGFKDFIAYKQQEATIAHDLATLVTPEDKISYLATKYGFSAAKQTTIEAIFNKPWSTLVDEFKAAGGSSGGKKFGDFLVQSAAKLQAPAVAPVGTFSVELGKGLTTPFGAFDQEAVNHFYDAEQALLQGDSPSAVAKDLAGKLGINYSDLVNGLNDYADSAGLSYQANPDSVLHQVNTKIESAFNKAAAVPKPILEGHLQKDSTTVLLNSSPSVTKDVGSKVTAPPADAKVFNYSANGVKVPVVFQPVAEGGTNVLVQEVDGQWYLLKPTSTGKTTKDEILQLLYNVNHSSSPF